jgi:adenine-specific DNA-methyltransferase
MMDSDSLEAGADSRYGAALGGVTPEQHYEQNSNATARRQRGQFFTPPTVAAAMTRWACPPSVQGNFLDPAVGAGIFIRQALALHPTRALTYYGYDIDAEVLHLAQATLGASVQVQLARQDFLAAPIHRKFAAIVCNPPYLKHHAIPDKAAVFARLRAEGLELPQTTNYYCLFLLRACQLLAANGRCAFIIPSEFLNADYGIAVKRHLLACGLLRGIILFDFKTQVFDGILTTACILLLENTPPEADIRLAVLHDPQALPALLEAWGTAVNDGWQRLPVGALDPARKWRNYFHAEETASASLVPLAQLARCMRGIATGCNDYFTLSQQELDRYGLQLATVRRCVTRARDAMQLVFDAAQLDDLAAQQRKVYLIDFGERPDAAGQAYLARGEALGIPQRFLPRHRRVWHAPENRPAADLWVQVFSRGRVRFILNAAGAANLTCFHGLYLAPAARPWRRLLWLYLNTPLCQELMRQERREYGGGLEKFEPRDIERLPVPDFARWPAAARTALEALAGQLLHAVHAPARCQSLLAQADGLIRAQLHLATGP